MSRSGISSTGEFFLYILLICGVEKLVKPEVNLPVAALVSNTPIQCKSQVSQLEG